MVRERCGGVLNFLTVLAAIVAGFAVMPSAQYAVFSLDEALPFLTGDEIIDSLYVGFTGQIVGAVVIYAFLLRVVRAKDAEYRPIRMRSLRTTLLSWAGSIPFVFGISLLLTLVFEFLGIVPETGYAGQLLLEPQHLANPFNIVIFFAVGTVGAPIYEELLFRRTAIPLLQQRGASPLTAIVVSSALFGTVHLPLDLVYGNAAGAFQHFLAVMTLGIVLGFVYVTTRNVVFPILIHAFMNGLSFAAVVGMLSNELVFVVLAVGMTYLLLIAVGFIVIIRAFHQYASRPNTGWVMMMRRKNPQCIKRGALWLLVLFIGVVALVNWGEILILPATAEIASPAVAYLAGAVLNLVVFLLFTAVATRTEIVPLPLPEEIPATPDLMSSEEDLL